MAALEVLTKDPDATLDYGFDWQDEGWLGSDTIVSATWTVPAGLTKVSETNTTTTATVWLSGGAVQSDYTVTCRITTAGGRIDDRSLLIQVRNR